MMPIHGISCCALRIAEAPDAGAQSRGMSERQGVDQPGIGRGHLLAQLRCRSDGADPTGSGRSMFVRLGGRVGRLVSAVPNIERPDPVCRPPSAVSNAVDAPAVAKTSRR